MVNWIKGAESPETLRSVADNGDSEDPLLSGDVLRRPGLPDLPARCGTEHLGPQPRPRHPLHFRRGLRHLAGGRDRPRTPIAGRRSTDRECRRTRSEGNARPCGRRPSALRCHLMTHLFQVGERQLAVLTAERDVTLAVASLLSDA